MTENGTAPSSSFNWLTLLIVIVVIVFAGVGILIYQNYQLAQNLNATPPAEQTSPLPSETPINGGLISGLADDFESDQMDKSSWLPIHKNAIQQDGMLFLTSLTGVEVGVDSVQEYSLNDSSIKIELVDPGLWESKNHIFTFGAGNTFFIISGGNLYAVIEGLEPEEKPVLMPFEPSIHRWLKISWDGTGNVYWEYSADGINWEFVRSAPPTGVLAATTYFGITSADNEFTNTVILDNFNVDPL